jgi:hypothetical protein
MNRSELAPSFAANAPGAVVRAADGVVLIATGLPLRLFNQVLVEGDGAKPEAIAAAVATTRDRGGVRGPDRSDDRRLQHLDRSRRAGSWVRGRDDEAGGGRRRGRWLRRRDLAGECDGLSHL